MIDEATLRRGLTVRHGRVAPGKASLYAIVRNESFFMPAFFAHYRALGVEQFLILDDDSTDGTRDFLAAQADCVLLGAPVPFGAPVRREGRTEARRAGTLLKRLIPQKYLAGSYALYVDADEFLILPPGLRSVPELFACLDGHDIACVAASLVEFYPQWIDDLSGRSQPGDLAGLIEVCPFYDAAPLVRLDAARGARGVGEAASTRLFRTYGVWQPTNALAWLPGGITLPGLRERPHSARTKTPVVRWRDGVELVGSHRANVPPTGRLLLALAHFKFTHDFSRKVDEAIATGAYAGGSSKYRAYRDLYRRMARRDGSFLGPQSRRYGQPADLAKAGLTYCRLDSPSALPAIHAPELETRLTFNAVALE